MRRWKGAVTGPEKVYLYFREHANIFFTEDHVAAQVGIGRRRTRKIVAFLVIEAKLEVVDTVASSRWGRPKKMFRAVRGMNLDDQLAQLEIMRDSFAAAGLGDPYG